MACQRPGTEGAQGDLEAELAVGADKRRWQHLAERDAGREIFHKTEV